MAAQMSSTKNLMIAVCFLELREGAWNLNCLTGFDGCCSFLGDKRESMELSTIVHEALMNAVWFWEFKREGIGAPVSSRI